MKRRRKHILLKIILGLIVLSVLFVLLYSFVPVWRTPLMLKRSYENVSDPNFSIEKKWVTLDGISPEVIKAVIASEDNKFCTHDGFDREEVAKMLEEHEKTGRKLRGCSTISQQTAKNVFTFGGRNLVRKIIEAYYTFMIEKIWGKRRIMEVYLNVAEWGDGVFGIEAAAQHYFGCSAAELTKHRAALLAACLPSPLERNPSKPSAYLNKRAASIERIMRQLKYPDWVVKN
ncbi:MAG: monofunctional biosynthetic peptidoglycan transglycosylase [Bacteroidales bacterium]|nr:monofunctional biosynthetic peptidoglycan transglycosylase [Bacteroidales bacterium]